ncbi:YhcH/YjgK/YiaL family protein [uncultured Aquimarina sp.]|uniref:YhcH/YjgK/YiaL family protein n=1 Tax=uncultured Aquimarina sp. TaxID=575652 RepID=UPI002602E022|nr:YhcH/YjgK/YiaL family protein [uncultured Aquimarina sp.]
MIFDTIDNKDQYFQNPIFEEIFSKLKTLTIDIPNGNYYECDAYYFKVISYDTKVNPTIIESHRKEVDIQILLSGNERIKIYNPKQVNISATYDKEIDCQFYKSIGIPDLELNLSPGKMAVFFPQDIHGCQYPVNNTIENIKKIVIKIDEKFFT